MRGIRGARWLLGENRRIGKVVCLDDEISFAMFEGGLRMKLKGRNLLVDSYDEDEHRTGGHLGLKT